MYTHYKKAFKLNVMHLLQVVHYVSTKCKMKFLFLEQIEHLSEWKYSFHRFIEKY